MCVQLPSGLASPFEGFLGGRCALAHTCQAVLDEQSRNMSEEGIVALNHFKQRQGSLPHLGVPAAARPRGVVHRSVGHCNHSHFCQPSARLCSHKLPSGPKFHCRLSSRGCALLAVNSELSDQPPARTP